MRSSLTTKCDYVPSGTLWPSGDFSYGWRRVDWHGPHKADRRNTKARIDDGVYLGQWTPEALKFREEYGHDGGVLQALDAEGFYQNPEDLSGEACPLDLTSARNSHGGANRPEKYGKKGITSFGRNMVKSAAALLEKMPNKRLTFATVTMPALPRQLRVELAKAWPEFVRQLLQTLTRWLKKVGLPALVVSCSEIQSGRLESYSEAYLHLHLVWPNHWAKSGNWAIDVDDLRTWVAEFLQRRGLWCEGAWVNVDTQQVKKSAAGYLAKYMSKGTAEIEKMADDCGWQSIPGQWWNMTKPLRDLVKKYTRKGDAAGRVLDLVVGYVLNTGDMSGVSVLSECTMDIDGHSVGVGWRGRVTREYRKDLIKMIDSAVAS